MLTRSTLSDVVKYAQRTLAECTQIFCARGVPDFRKFCKFFARFLRKICVISTLDSRVIAEAPLGALGSIMGETLGREAPGKFGSSGPWGRH